MFSYSVDLDERVHSEHPLRKIREVVDFGFAREQTAQFYGNNGNESVDPAVVMKLMFLLFYDNVSSERELMRMLPYRLDYLWFLDFGLDDTVPDHSVLSKARRRWGPDVFENLFARTVAMCMEAGLVDGTKVHIDASLVEASAASDACVRSCPELIAQLRESLADEMNKFDEVLAGSHQTPVNSRQMSTTDPDSEWAGKRNERGRFRHKTHRAVDDQCGVVTAVETTPGATGDDKRLMPLLDQHEALTGAIIKTAVADAQYGTRENLVACHERGIRSHMAHVDHTGNLPHPEDRFGPGDFTYNEEGDTLTCPAGELLRFSQLKGSARTYRCRGTICNSCRLKSKCTSSKQGRSIRWYLNQQQFEKAREESNSPQARQDRLRRKWLAEGSFADAANNHGLKRSRWRRLWRQRIQDLIIAAVQNLRKLLKTPKYHPAKAETARARVVSSPERRQPILLSTVPAF